jgi:hypothetical protein
VVLKAGDRRVGLDDGQACGLVIHRIVDRTTKAFRSASMESANPRSKPIRESRLPSGGWSLLMNATVAVHSWRESSEDLGAQREVGGGAVACQAHQGDAAPFKDVPLRRGT